MIKDRNDIEELRHDMETNFQYPEDEKAQKQLEKQCREEVLADPDRGEWLCEAIRDLTHSLSNFTWNELFDSIKVLNSEPHTKFDPSEFGWKLYYQLYPLIEKRIQEETEVHIARTLEARKDD